MAPRSKLGEWKEVSVKQLNKGWLPDIPRSEIPAGGFATLDGFKFLDKQLEKCLGWVNLSPAANSTITFALDWVAPSGNTYAYIGTTKSGASSNLYSFDRQFGSIVNLTSGGGGQPAAPLGTDHIRWQSATLDTKLFFVFPGDRPIDGAFFYVDESAATTVALVSALNSDGQTPKGPNFILNCADHLVTDSPSENSQRVRWSDLSNPGVWTPVSSGASSNEAGFLDIDEGVITGMAPLGPNQFLVYTNNSIYIYTYVGYPQFFTKFRIVDDIGCSLKYSLVSTVDVHYFVSTQGFYSYNGVGTPKPIGYNRVDLSFEVPDSCFAFAHSTNPEIWWSQNYGAIYIYNYIDNCWALQSGFNMSAVASSLGMVNALADVRIWGGDTSVKWLETGNTYGNGGAPVQGVIETGDLAGRYRYSRLGRVNYGIIPSPLGLGVTSEIASFTNPGDAVVYSPPVTLDDDSRHDEFHTDKLFSLRLKTNSAVSVLDFSLWMQPGGERL